MIEGTIEFQFSDKYSSVIKFDDMPFYRQHFNNLPSAKGVDFLAMGKNDILFLEVKDCAGSESDNRWRIFPNNRKRGTSTTSVDTDGRDSLDIEVPKKVAMTLACLLEATTKRSLEKQNRLDAGEKLLSLLLADNIPDIKVILFLEGDFQSHSRTPKMIMKSLKDSMKKKLSWLQCKVLVENMDIQTGKYYQAKRANDA